MKTLIIAIILVATSCNNHPKQIRYFEYGCVFKLNNGCKSASQTTIKVHGCLTYDQITQNTLKWVYPLKIVDLHVWYLKEVTAGEMYVFTEKFSCKQIKWTGVDNTDTIKNTNNFLLLKSK